MEATVWLGVTAVCQAPACQGQVVIGPSAGLRPLASRAPSLRRLSGLSHAKERLSEMEVSLNALRCRSRTTSRHLFFLAH